MEQQIQSTGEAKRNPVDLEEIPVDPSILQNVGMVYTKDISGVTELFYEDDAGVVTQLTGGTWTQLPNLTTIQRNAMIVGWGIPESGRAWFNTTTSQFEGWNGTTVAILG